MAQQDKQLSFFPAFFKVENAVTAVFGNGDEAYAKAREQVQQEVPRAQLVAAVQQMLTR